MLAQLALLVPCLSFHSAGTGPVQLPGLRAPALITRDSHGIAHVRAQSEHDVFFLQGYVHAQDRLFQMDVSRRQASGTLAELFGADALPSDVQLRTLGMLRAAFASMAAASPRMQSVLEAYARGVNAYLATGPLPPEYGVLELTSVEPWKAVDGLAVAKLIALGLAFELDIDRTFTLLSYIQAGAGLGFDGAKLYTEDLHRFAPFDAVATIPDATDPNPSPATGSCVDWKSDLAARAAFLHPETLELGRAVVERMRAVDVLRATFERRRNPVGSNEWVLSGEKTSTGFPLHANDPHLALGWPSTFYPIHLRRDGFDVVGESFPGAPTVILGHNRRISWSATVNALDVTDTYQEQVVVDPNSPSGLSTLYLGQPEPIVPVPEVFRANQLNGVPDDLVVVPPDSQIPAATLIVPRRNNGPIVGLDLSAGIALSVQYTGSGATHELECFLALAEADDLAEFVDGLQYFDVASLNVAYSDVDGHIACFATAEAPVREDLQAYTVVGLPPFFIRDGAGGNEWKPVANPQYRQALPYEILAFDEMPQLVDPVRGWFENANNDPLGSTFDNDPLNQIRAGGGLFYLAYAYSDGTRAYRVRARCREELAGGGTMSPAEMESIQADTVDRTADVLVPRLLRAFTRAQDAAADPVLHAFAGDAAIVEAVGRVAAWDHTTPTGIAEGFDASDTNGVRVDPTPDEIDASVAATLYSVWCGRALENVIDVAVDAIGLERTQVGEAALRHLLDEFGSTQGVGASGIDFFQVPGVADARDRRDVLLLQSLRDALDLLAGPEFASAFHQSTNQGDYRWGLLHRIVLDHAIGGPLSVPPALGAFPPPLAGLDGIPVDGGRTVDAAYFDPRADDADGFLFDEGPVRRFVSEATPNGVRAVSITPGGTSGVPGSPHYLDQLPLWLTNDTLPLLFESSDILQDGGTTTRYAPDA